MVLSIFSFSQLFVKYCFIKQVMSTKKLNISNIQCNLGSFSQDKDSNGYEGNINVGKIDEQPEVMEVEKEESAKDGPNEPSRLIQHDIDIIAQNYM